MHKITKRRKKYVERSNETKKKAHTNTHNIYKRFERRKTNHDFEFGSLHTGTLIKTNI